MSRKNADFVFRLKSGPCMDCGLCYSPDAMDFDHVHGVKIANISDLISGSRARLLEELRKTELVCANCHRLREMHRRLDGHVGEADEFDVDALLAD